MAWCVEFKDGAEAQTQFIDDRDEAVLVASYLHSRGQRVIAITPFGRDSYSQREITGPELRSLLPRLAPAREQSSQSSSAA
jgi:hypothetical protein